MFIISLIFTRGYPRDLVRICMQIFTGGSIHLANQGGAQWLVHKAKLLAANLKKFAVTFISTSNDSGTLIFFITARPKPRTLYRSHLRCRGSSIFHYDWQFERSGADCHHAFPSYLRCDWLRILQTRHELRHQTTAEDGWAEQAQICTKSTHFRWFSGNF